MGFWMGLLQGAISSGASSFLGGQKDGGKQLMGELDSFMAGMESETKGSVKDTFQFSDLDFGDNLGTLLAKQSSRAKDESDLALFTGEATSKEKFKNLGQKISRGQSLGLFDFI